MQAKRKLWIDSRISPPDNSWTWAQSVRYAQNYIIWWDEFYWGEFEECSIGYGELSDGGSFVDIIIWMSDYDFWPNQKPVAHTTDPSDKYIVECFINSRYQYRRLLVNIQKQRSQAGTTAPEPPTPK